MRIADTRTHAIAMIAMLALLVAACTGAPTASFSGQPPGSTAPGSPTGAALPTTAIPDLSNITLEPTRAERAIVGSPGGQIEATGSDGTRYRLTIPQGALASKTEIVAVPLIGIAGLPGAVVASGVHFLPEGLTLSVLGKLSVIPAKAPSGPTIAFGYRGDLGDPIRYPVQEDDGEVIFGVTHFSGYGLLASTAQAISAAEFGLLIPWGPPAGPADTALAAIAPVYQLGADPDRNSKVNAIMKTWLDSLIALVAEFGGMTTWDLSGPFASRASTIRQSFNLWLYLEKLFVLAGVQLDPALGTQVGNLEVSAATHGISVTNTGCSAASSGELLILRVPEEFVWQRWAAELGVAGRDPTLDIGFVQEHLCVQVMFDPNGGTDFPSGITAGQTGTLSLKVGYAVDGGPPRFDARFEMTVTPHGASPADIVRELSSSTGTLSHAFAWDPAATELRLDIQACVEGIPACQDAFVVRGSPAVPVALSISPSDPAVKPGGGLQLTVTGAPANSVTWSTSWGSITANGLFTADSREGLVRVTATLTSDPNSKVVGFISVYDPASKEIYAFPGGVPPLFRSADGHGFCSDKGVCAHFGRNPDGMLVLAWTEGTGGWTSFIGVDSYTTTTFQSGAVHGTVAMTDPAALVATVTITLADGSTFVGKGYPYLIQ